MDKQANDQQRILIIPSWYPPDGGSFFRDHAAALAEAGFSIDMLVNRIAGLTKFKFSELRFWKKFRVYTEHGFRVIRSYYLKPPRSEMFMIKPWTRSTLRLYKKYERKFGPPDLIIAQSAIWAGLAASRIKEKYGIPYIVIEHRGRFAVRTREAEYLIRESFRPYFEPAFRKADRIITVSDSLHYGIGKFCEEDQEIQTIPNMVDTGFWTLPETPRTADPFIILSVGRFEHEKGFDLLLEAFDLVAEDNPEAELRIAGKGSLETELKEMVARTGARDRIRFLGYLEPEDLLKEMHQARVLAVSSRIEAFGMVFAEAMSTGMPVLATEAGGPQSVIPDYAGVLAGCENVPSLFVGLKNIHAHYADYNPEKIRRHVVRKFSRKAVTSEFAALFESLRKKSSGPGMGPNNPEK